MTLALLITAATGAWAKTDPNAVYWTNEIWAGWAENVTTHTVGDHLHQQWQALQERQNPGGR